MSNSTLKWLVVGANRGLGLALAQALVDRGEQVVATCRDPEAAPELAVLGCPRLALDVTDEASIAAAADELRQRWGQVDRVLAVAGLLHDGELQPEKKLDQIDPANLMRVFAVNAFGPLLLAKHLTPLFRRDADALFASLSARVGSISDNRLGGWYAYRGSKAAQNMFTKNLAIELGRRSPRWTVVGLHPGTVDTGLSKPFQRHVKRLFDPAEAAAQLLTVIDGLGPEDSGKVFAWDGQAIAP